jgi:hypothetical protein
MNNLLPVCELAPKDTYHQRWSKNYQNDEAVGWKQP